ncbi:MAG: TraB/GumN family protein [Arenimonas sp.]|uniref:TraB/GumN family protein n=1 Tax=Arenimonas sp. TaxID=1872635 RepID=UPI0025B97AA2|nr:TraB/GumN family protein [Arenimonas sp.]MBW8369119.1 TraB/GumN family protein [Arenimonas sp.]
MFKPVIAALLLATTACAVHAEPPTPLLWKVSDADNSIYLLGSFHLLKDSDYPLADSTYDALADAEHVVFELSPAEMNDPALGQKMGVAAMRTDGKTLQQSLPEETWEQLSAYTAKRNIPVANFQPYEAWFISLMVSITEMQLVGLDPEKGLDKHFAERAIKAGKPVSGLETGDQQIALFDGMDEKEQLQALQDTLAEVANIESEIDKMHALWRAGDGEGLFAATAADMKREYPALYQRVNVERNQAWLPRLAAMLDDSSSDDTLVVVGAMHLLGDDGVVAMLKAKGYRVERL